ncbi:MAG: hypothetical protein WC312_03735 [Candidatus Omnitrophota bacterium]|jgi:hypothetical protein
MKCVDCSDFVDNLCQKAQLGKISEVEETTCLLKMQISVLRSIWEELVDLNANFTDGEDWKK